MVKTYQILMSDAELALYRTEAVGHAGGRGVTAKLAKRVIQLCAIVGMLQARTIRAALGGGP